MNRQLRGNLPPNEKANGKNRFLSLLLLFMAFISRTGICAGRQSFRYSYRGS